MKKALHLFALAILFVLAWTQAADALPLLGIAVTAIAGGFAAAAAGASLLWSVVIGLGEAALSYVAQSAMKGAKPDTVQSYQKMQTGGILPQSFIFGTWSTAGSLVYFNYWAKSSSKSPNAYETRVIALSDLPSTALIGLIVDDNVCTYGSGTPDDDLGYAIPEYADGGNNYLWVKFYDGAQTEADPFLVSKFSSDAARPYDSGRVGKGRTYVLLTIRKNDQNLSESSTFKFVVKGAPWYDPRKDTTAGGSGSHRFDDPSTWEYSENPQLIRYNIRRGVYFGDQWMFGVQGMSAARLPFDNWSAALNDCDTDVDTNAGGTEPQYRCGGELSVDTEPASIDESLMRACNARSIEVGGIYKTTTGVAASPTKSYTDADFIITSPATLNPYPGLSGTVNGITGHFPDPTQNWQSVDLPARLNSDLEVIDGNRQLIADINYDCVPFNEQAQRNMQAALDEDRRFRVHNVVWPHSEWENEPGDTFNWTSAEHGYDDKLFRIDQITLLANRDLQATVREVDPSDYDWDPSSDFIPHPIGSLGANPIPSQVMSGWEAVAETINGDGTPPRASPGIRMSFDTEDMDDVDGILFEVKRADDGSLVISGESPHSVEGFQAGSVLIGGAAIKSDTHYQVRGKYRPISNRLTSWSDWIDVTTDTVQITAEELWDEAVGFPKLAQDVKDMQNFIGASTRSLIDEMLQMSQGVAEGLLGGASDVQTLRTELHSTTSTLKTTITADYTNAITVATGPTSAIAQSITELQAAIGDSSLTDTVDALADTVTALSATVTGQGSDITANSTSIDSLSAALTGYTSSGAVSTAFSGLNATVTSQGDDITANSDAITSTNATVGNFSASGLFRASSVASLHGSDSTVALSASTSSGGSAATAALYITSKSGVSEIIMQASKTYILDDAGNPVAVFGSGGAAFNSALIVDLTAGNISANSITVNELHDNAATLAEINTGSGGALTGPSNWVNQTSISITTRGGKVLICAGYDIGTSSGVQGVATRITRDGSTIRTTNNYVPVTLSSYGMFWSDSPSAGSHTYNLDAEGPSVCTTSSIQFFVVEFTK